MNLPLVLAAAVSAALATGQEPELLVTLPATGGQSGFGLLMIATQDLDGDGRSDVGIPSALGRSGRFQAVSSVDLSPLLDVASDRLSLFCAQVGDATGDGIRDLLCFDVEGTTGRLSIVDSANGDLVTKVDPLHNLGGTSFQAINLPFGPAPDVNGDGRRDFWMQSKSSGSGSTNFFEVRSGAAPSQTLYVVTGDNRFESVDVIGDVTGDGVEEFAVGDTITEAGPGFFQRGEVRIVSGATGATLTRIAGTSDTFDFGSFVRSVGDVDGDGLPDFGAALREVATPQVRIYSGSNGALIHTLVDPINTLSSDFGDAISGVGDVDGDGVNDIGVGSPGYSETLVNQGAAYVFSGATGDLLAATYGTAISDSMGSSIRGAGDVNGDGREDWLVGSPSNFTMPGRIEGYGLVQTEVVIDFEVADDFSTPIANGAALEEVFSTLVSIRSMGPGQVGPAAFDSSISGPNDGGADPDLLVGRGNLLILQEDATQSTPGIYDFPDDASQGGTLQIQILQPAEPLSLVLVDICPAPTPQDAVVRLVDASRRTRTFRVPTGFTADGELAPRLAARTLQLDTLADQPGYVATATATEDPGFDSTRVVLILVQLRGSGAVDDLRLRLR
ncbi:FG-GAP repeat protein [Planctomycetes bacterium Poly30]|uniref:FG-GAP repeat protein n=1 Tax=Saltatorellus ferox TaxID=2528018 RepID=A0A518EY06_9BACT|nr:FG-GAP repeat protein [Planctomycetes bacterium Poly30]